MSKFQTIQKVSLDMGINESLIHSLIKKQEISKYKLKGHSRVFVDIKEIESLMISVNDVQSSQIDLDIFEV